MGRNKKYMNMKHLEAAPEDASQAVKKPFREVWRAKALQMQSESGDTCGGFGSLALQGFLAPFPAREPHGGERETA